MPTRNLKKLKQINGFFLIHLEKTPNLCYNIGNLCKEVAQ